MTNNKSTLNKNKSDEFTFKEIKRLYIDARKKEQSSICNYFNELKDKGEWEVWSKGKVPVEVKVKNAPHFTATSPKYKNWFGTHLILQYREGNTVKEAAFFISLQSFDLDSRTNNYHVIMDRLGVYKFHDCCLCKYNKEQENQTNDSNGKDKGTGELKTVNAINEMKITDIDLPMTEEKFNALKKFIADEYLNVL